MKQYILIGLLSIGSIKSVSSETSAKFTKIMDGTLTVYSLYPLKKALASSANPRTKILTVTTGLIVSALSIITTATHPQAEEIIGKKILTSCLGAHVVASIQPCTTQLISQTIPKNFAALYGFTSLVYLYKNVVTSFTHYKLNLDTRYIK